MNMLATISPIINPTPVSAVKVCSKRTLKPKKSSKPPVVRHMKSISINAELKPLMAALIPKLEVAVTSKRKVDEGNIWGPLLSKHICQKALSKLSIFLNSSVSSKFSVLQSVYERTLSGYS